MTPRQAHRIRVGIVQAKRDLNQLPVVPEFTSADTLMWTAWQRTYQWRKRKPLNNGWT